MIQASRDGKSDSARLVPVGLVRSNVGPRPLGWAHGVTLHRRKPVVKNAITRKGDHMMGHKSIVAIPTEWNVCSH